MALIKCIECGNQVSDQAKSCPECGCPFEQQKIEKKIICFECENEYSLSKKSCPKCGAPNNKRSKYGIGDLSPNDEKVREKVLELFKKLKKRKKIISIIFGGGLVYLFLLNLFSQNNQYQRQPIIIQPPVTPSSPPIKVPTISKDALCNTCRIMGDCSFMPGCSTQTTCTQQWDAITGSFKTICNSF